MIRKSVRGFHMFLLMASCLLAVSCMDVQQADNADQSIDSDLAQLESMKQEILDYVGDAVCSSAEGCRYIALGEKPCGGPWEYIIYCADSLDEDQLNDMVAEYNGFEHEMNEKYQLVSDCEYIMPPEELVWDNGHCITGKKD